MKKMICWTLLLGLQRRMCIFFLNPRKLIILVWLTLSCLRSRLGCQVIASPELDGIRLALPAATRNFAVDEYVAKSHWLTKNTYFMKVTCWNLDTCSVWQNKRMRYIVCYARLVISSILDFTLNWFPSLILERWKICQFTISVTSWGCRSHTLMIIRLYRISNAWKHHLCWL